MLSTLRRLASRGLAAVWRRTLGMSPGQGLSLFDLPRLNDILAAGGLPPLTSPPAPDATAGDLALRMYEMAPELREGLPLGLTPRQRESLLQWAIHTSNGAHRVTAGQMLALLAHLDTLPDRGLELTYRLTPEWQQAVPDALTRPGWKRLKQYLRAKYDLRGWWFNRARLARPEPPPPSGRGVNVLAHFEYPSGLQQAAVGLVDALHRAGVPTSLRDLPVQRRTDPASPRKLGFEVFDTTVVIAAVNSFADEWYRRAGLWMRPGVRRIAVWYWEMEDVPAGWVPRLGWADEVWAPTRFIADAFRKVVKVPVRAVPPGLELPAFPPLPRSHFDLPDGRFLFLFTFDMASTLARKNPLGLIEAFRRAFRRDEPVELVLKVSRGEERPADLERLKAACAANGVRLINRVLPRNELLALVACCDSYVSLHRSEGLGLGMAEAMLMAKPVVATGYSANLDFMTDDNSYLVRAGRAVCGPGNDPYPEGFVWGDPDLDHAAELLRRVYDQPAEARATGERAARYAREHLSIDAYSQRLAAALTCPATPSGGLPCSSSMHTSTSP